MSWAHEMLVSSKVTFYIQHLQDVKFLDTFITGTPDSHWRRSEKHSIRIAMHSPLILAVLLNAALSVVLHCYRCRFTHCTGLNRASEKAQKLAPNSPSSGTKTTRIYTEKKFASRYHVHVSFRGKGDAAETVGCHFLCPQIIACDLPLIFMLCTEYVTNTKSVL